MAGIDAISLVASNGSGAIGVISHTGDERGPPTQTGAVDGLIGPLATWYNGHVSTQYGLAGEGDIRDGDDEIGVGATNNHNAGVAHRAIVAIK